MSNLIARRALLLAGGVALVAPTAFAAGTGLPVMERGMEGANANRVFADRIDRAVAKDPTGNAPIEGGAGGFYKPIHVYETLRAFHPDLGFTKANPGKDDFAQMTEYIRTLELVPLAEAGTYRNSRVVRTGKTYRLDLSWERKLPKGTLVYTDRNTGVAIFKKNCANGIALVLECVELHFNAAAGMLVQVYIASEHEFAMPNRCLAYRQGEGAWLEWKGACGLANCDYSMSISEVRTLMSNQNLKALHPLGYKATADAQTLRFDQTVYQKVVVICLIWVDANGRRSWASMYMRPQDWKGRRVAFIDNSLWQWRVF